MWRTRLGEQFLDVDAPATLARQEMRGTLDYSVSWERRSGRFGLDAKLNKPPPRTAPRPSGTTWSSVQSARAALFAVLAATFVASILLLDGKSTWFTGVQLIAVYVVMAITVFAIPA